MADDRPGAGEHELTQELTVPLATVSDQHVSLPAEPDFPVVLRGYDRIAVDAYVQTTNQLVAELEAMRSPDAAVRRALERVGEEVSAILQRAHDTAAQMTEQSRVEARARLEKAGEDAAEITAQAQRQVKELGADSDRIWAERQRIVHDARGLAQELIALADAAEQLPPAADDLTAPENE
jgi:chromosome segregation ATPase